MRDPKMRRLTPSERWLWVAILSASRESCRPGWLLVSERVPFTDTDLADYAGMKSADVSKGINRMCDLGMMERDTDLGSWFLPNWCARQYESDDASERVARHRAKKLGSNGDVTVATVEDVTPPETEAETDTDKPPVAPRKRGSVVPADWRPSEESIRWWKEQPGRNHVNPMIELQAFRDYSAASGKAYRDFDAAWKNWMRNRLPGGRFASR